MGRRVAAQFVRDDHARATETLEQAAHEPVGGGRVATALHQHLKEGAVFVHRPPPPVLFAVDRHDHLVKMPFVAAPQR